MRVSKEQLCEGRRATKRISLLICTAVVSLLLLSVTASAEAASSVYVTPRQVGPSPAGSDFTVEVKIDNASDLAAWEIQIMVNPSFVKIKNFTEGEFLRRNGGSTISVGPNYSSDGEKVTYAAARTGKGPGISGSGTLGSLTLTVIKEGVSSVDLSYLELLDSKGAQTALANTANNFSNNPVVPTSVAFSSSEIGGSGGSYQPASATVVSEPRAQETPQLAEINGRVVNQAGQIIPGATAQINGIVMRTDSSGGFTFTLVYPEIYKVHYDAPGYISQTQVIQVIGGIENRPPTVILSPTPGSQIGPTSQRTNLKGRRRRKRVGGRRIRRAGGKKK